jgi:hypothetical protein
MTLSPAKLKIAIAIGCIVVVVVIALGIGLGLGLRKTTAPPPAPELDNPPKPKRVGPLDGKGAPVDWWFILKLPQGAPCACATGPCDKLDRKTGGCYLYADSSNPTLRMHTALEFDCLSGPNNPATKTLRQAATQTLVWNDQAADTSVPGKYGECGAPRAHSKGAAYMGDAGVGFILNTSTPNFPDPDSSTLGCQKLDNTLVSQHMFCFAVDAANMEKWKAAVIAARLCVIASKNFAYSAPATPRLPTQEVELQTVGRLPIKLLVKSAADDYIPWDMVASKLDADLSVLSWYADPRLAPLCAGAPSPCLSGGATTAERSVSIVTKVTLPDKSYSWCGRGLPNKSSNHAKVAVAASGTPWVVMGSMNMQGNLTDASCESSQMGRGGDFYALQHPALHASLSALFSACDACEGTTDTCYACPSSR